MFTGLIEAMGTVREVAPRRGVTRLSVVPGFPVGELVAGESVAVDGVCLTVSGRSRDRFHADVIPETMSRTTLGDLRPGRKVNLERALRVGDRLGGHLVQGHVDTVSEMVRLTRRGGDYRLRVAMAAPISRYVAEKGSIALNGVSLTVTTVDADGFEVALIPETLSHTNLSKLRPGDRLNVEVDLLSRYLERLVAQFRPPDGGGDRARGRRGKAGDR